MGAVGSLSFALLRADDDFSLSAVFWQIISARQQRSAWRQHSNGRALGARSLAARAKRDLAILID